MAGRSPSKWKATITPSAIEPFQGAATGVGGIIRDIFTMGARPEFCLNSLRLVRSAATVQMSQPIAAFSPASFPESRITEIASGFPPSAAKLFRRKFRGQSAGDVFCLGVLRHDQLARGAARGVGNPVFYVGAETGRDGLAGAAFASRELTEQSKEDRPAVQVGDPFKESFCSKLVSNCSRVTRSAGFKTWARPVLTCSDLRNGEPRRQWNRDRTSQKFQSANPV